MEKFRAEGELPGDITLKIRRAVQRAPGGKQQMLMLGEINHRAEVERGVRASAGGQRGAMINFRAEQNLFATTTAGTRQRDRCPARRMRCRWEFPATGK